MYTTHLVFLNKAHESCETQCMNKQTVYKQAFGTKYRWRTIDLHK